MNCNFLAIIPARAGSKRIPNKNLQLIAGQPLIFWTIKAALNSKYISNIIVTSDSDEILQFCENYKIQPLKRPSYLATDEAKTNDVVLNVLENITYSPDFIILLQPTSPLRTNEHIDKAIEFLFRKNADAVISVTPLEYPLQWANILPNNLSLENFIDKEHLNRRSQDFPTYYRINGAIYIVKTNKFWEQKTFFINKNIYAFVMDRESSIDIDEWIDFKLADLLLKEKLSNFN